MIGFTYIKVLILKILIPLDGSERALNALHHAMHLHQEGLRASFVLAAVQDPVYGYEKLLPTDASLVDRLSGAMGERALAEAEALLNAAGIPFERKIASGEPAAVLLDIAQQFGCSAIIISTRGRGALRSALLGSVSQAVLQSATIPVTLVNHRAQG